MNRDSGYIAHFSSAHSSGDSHRGDATVRLHGHDFQVWVKAECPWSSLIMKDVTDIAYELNGRQLEDMMPGSATDATSVAAWFMERLSMKYPTVVEVSIIAGGHSDTVGRDRQRVR